MPPIAPRGRSASVEDDCASLGHHYVEQLRMLGWLSGMSIRPWMHGTDDMLMFMTTYKCRDLSLMSRRDILYDGMQLYSCHSTKSRSYTFGCSFNYVVICCNYIGTKSLEVKIGFGPLSTLKTNHYQLNICIGIISILPETPVNPILVARRLGVKESVPRVGS